MLTVTVNEEARVTQKAQNLSRAMRGTTVYVVREGYGLRAVKAEELADKLAPEILAAYRQGEEIETPETFPYMG